jgi:hypothetical protein
MEAADRTRTATQLVEAVSWSFRTTFRERELRTLFNLERPPDWGRSDVDAELVLEGSAIPDKPRGQRIPFELKSATKGKPNISHSETIIPLPEAEQYPLGVQCKRRQVERDHEQKARAGRLLPRLLEAGALEIGQILYFRRDAVPSEAAQWSRKEPLYQATL